MENTKKKINPLNITNLMFAHYGMSIIDPSWFEMDLNLTKDDCMNLIDQSKAKVKELKRLVDCKNYFRDSRSFSNAGELVEFFNKSKSLYENEDEFSMRFYTSTKKCNKNYSWDIYVNVEDSLTVDDLEISYHGEVKYLKKNDYRSELNIAIAEQQKLHRNILEITNPAVALLKHHRDIVAYIGRQMKLLLEYEEVVLPDSFDELIEMVRNEKPLVIRVTNLCESVVGKRCNVNVAHILDPSFR